VSFCGKESIIKLLSMKKQRLRKRSPSADVWLRSSPPYIIKGVVDFTIISQSMHVETVRVLDGQRLPLASIENRRGVMYAGSSERSGAAQRIYREKEGAHF